jgi:outer membrane biosynthesis protein TonB
MSDPKWFYARGEERFGPVTSQKLKALAAAGKLQPADLIWKEDMADWSPASQLRGLFPPESASGEATLPTSVEESSESGGHAPPIEPANPEMPTLNTEPEQASTGLGFTSSTIPPSPSRPWRGQLNPRSISKTPLNQVAQYGQVLLLLGLVLVVLSKGCDGIGNRYASRLNSQYELVVNQFEDIYTEKQNQVKEEVTQLQQQIGDEAPTPEQREKQTDLVDKSKEIEKQRGKALAKNQRTKWARMKIKSRDSAANNNMWGFWRECVFALGTLVLTVGLLTVGFNGQGADRWICLIMLAIVTFSIYVGGIAWISSIISLIPK